MADWPLIIAHRGLPRSAPENTLPSFLAALEHQPDVVECDYVHSADGRLVVLHDATLDRTTDAEVVLGGRKIRADGVAWNDLQRLDAGTWFGPQFAGTKLPSLEETIDAVCPRARLMIERKAGDAAALVELLRRKNVFDRVVVQAFHWPFIADCHRLEPRITLGVLGEKELTPAKVEEAAAIGATIIGWGQADLTPPAIQAAHEAGLKVWSWTINLPERARELTAAGLDGIITDRADVVREWLRS
jgi:glycerophosphoryl diester phosphodiesterase